MGTMERDSVDAAIREKAKKLLEEGVGHVKEALRSISAPHEAEAILHLAFEPLRKLLEAGAMPPAHPTYGWRCVCGHESETLEALLIGHRRGARCRAYRAALSGAPRAAPLKTVSMPSRDLLDIDATFDSEKKP
jgi:hypothetical protein